MSVRTRLREKDLLDAVLAGISARKSQARLAEETGVSRTRVANLSRLRRLPPGVLGLVRAGALSTRAAEELLRLAAPARQLELARDIAESGLRLAEVRARVDQILGRTARAPRVAATTTAAVADPNIRRLQDGLGEWLGAPCEIRHQSDGSGEFVVRYFSSDELSGVLLRSGFPEA